MDNKVSWEIELDELFDIVISRRFLGHKIKEDPYTWGFTRRIGKLLESNGLFVNCEISMDTYAKEMFPVDFEPVAIPLCIRDHHGENKLNPETSFAKAVVRKQHNTHDVDITIHSKDRSVLLHNGNIKEENDIDRLDTIYILIQ